MGGCNNKVAVETERTPMIWAVVKAGDLWVELGFSWT